MRLPTKAEISRASKPDLQKWCRRYSLKTSGMIPQLRERLVKYLDTRRVKKVATAKTLSLPELAQAAEQLLLELQRERVNSAQRQSSLIGQLIYVFREFQKKAPKKKAKKRRSKGVQKK